MPQAVQNPDPKGRELYESFVCVVRRYLESVEDVYFNTPRLHEWSTADSENIGTELRLQLADFKIILDRLEEIA